MISVSTMPEAGPPMRRRAWLSASRMAPVVVSVRSMVIAASLLQAPAWTSAPYGRSQAPPCAAVPCHQRLGRRRARRTRRILLRLGVRGPEILHRVQDPPAQLDFLLPGEQRRVADQDVEQQPLVGLGTGLGERLAVGEVHVHVPYFHRRARHLGAEPDGDALIRLDPDDQRVLAE